MNGSGQITVTQPQAELIESERLFRVRDKALIGAAAGGGISPEIHSARSTPLQELKRSAVG